MIDVARRRHCSGRRLLHEGVHRWASSLGDCLPIWLAAPLANVPEELGQFVILDSGACDQALSVND